MFLLGFLLGMVVFFAVAVTTEIIIGKIEGYFVYGFTFLWIHLTRNHYGEPLKKCSGSFAIFPSVTLSKSEVDMAEDKKRVIKHCVVLGIIILVLTGLTIWLFIAPKFGSGIRAFYGPLWFLAALYLFYFAIVEGYRKQLSGPAADIAATYNIALQSLRRGANYEQLVLPSEKLRRPGISDRVSIFYLSLCFMRALALKDIREMSDVCRALDRFLMKESTLAALRSGTSHYESAYSAVLLFSSYIRPHPENASKYFRLIRSSLEQDEDFNSKVVLAFYYFKITRRPDVAANLVSQAEINISTADPNKVYRAEIDLYKRLIDELKDLLDMTGGTYFEPRPVISYED